MQVAKKLHCHCIALNSVITWYLQKPPLHFEKYTIQLAASTKR